MLPHPDQHWCVHLGKKPLKDQQIVFMLLSQPAFIAKKLLWEKDIPIKIIKGPISTFFVNIASASVPTLVPYRKHILDPPAVHVRAHMEEREIRDISALESWTQLLHPMQELELGWVSHLLLQLGAWGKLLSSSFSAVQSSRSRDVINGLGPWASILEVKILLPLVTTIAALCPYLVTGKMIKNQNFKPSCSSGSLLLFTHIRSNAKTKPK